MRIGNTEQLRKEIRDSAKRGFKFSVYAYYHHGRRRIVEISGVKKWPGEGIAGFSWQCSFLRQSQLRRIEMALRQERGIKVKLNEY